MSGLFAASQTGRRWLPALLAGLLLAGCAAPQSTLLRQSGLPEGSTLLSGVPFIPQTEHHCGPAALAMAMQYAGTAATPEQLAGMVYLPGREGSLAVEMQAAPRRLGLVGWRLPPRLDALLDTVAAGQPVVVLQNLGLSWLPRWHYAVVIGFDPASQDLILHSGITERERINLDTFEHTWARGDYWAIQITQPDRLPAQIDENQALQQATGLERAGQAKAASQLYAAMLQRWPQQPLALFGAGNAAYALGDASRAEQLWLQQANSAAPLPQAVHNLIELYREQQRGDAASHWLAIARQRWPGSPLFP